MNLEQLLQELSKYGNPRVSKMKSGWYAAVDMFVVGRGVEFKIDSEFKSDHVTAAKECLDRVYAALTSLKDKMPTLKG